MDDLTRIREAVEELVEPRRHEEPFTYRSGSTWITDRHVTQVPSLIDQLSDAIPGRVGDATSRSFTSRTPGRDDALDVLALIDTEAGTWCQRYAKGPRRDTAGSVRALVGIATRLEDDDLKDLRWNCTSWVALARVTTGWDKPAVAFNTNTCPLCGKKGGLRIRVDVSISNTDAHAACLNCREHWDRSNIGLLGSHIRWENDEPEEASA